MRTTFRSLNVGPSGLLNVASLLGHINAKLFLGENQKEERTRTGQQFQDLVNLPASWG
jgi:hypothetical protein